VHASRLLARRGALRDSPPLFIDCYSETGDDPIVARCPASQFPDVFLGQPGHCRTDLARDELLRQRSNIIDPLRRTAGCVSNALIFPKGALISNKSSSGNARIRNALFNVERSRTRVGRYSCGTRRSLSLVRVRPRKRKRTRRESKTRVSDPSRRDRYDGRRGQKSAKTFRVTFAGCYSPRLVARARDDELETTTRRGRTRGGAGGSESASARRGLCSSSRC